MYLCLQSTVNVTIQGNSYLCGNLNVTNEDNSVQILAEESCICKFLNIPVCEEFIV
jgi:hypothetical protein